MKKIDDNLLKYFAFAQIDRKYFAIVYYDNKAKIKEYVNRDKINVLFYFDFINACIIECNSNNLLKISSLGFVKYISSVANVNALMNVSRKIIGTENIEYHGKGQTIAFIDTGISSHFDFCVANKKICFFKDFVNGVEHNYDDNGHGTFVSGVACGSGLLSNKKYCGVASDANIVSLKALDNSGEANAITILQAMEWVYNNYKQYNIGVVCMSFGSEPLGIKDPIMIGAEKLWDKGIIVVCAGGNSGPKQQTIKSPGISRKIITVGGLDDKRDEFGNFSQKNFVVADFSSRGPSFGKIKPDIIAPSVNIVACSHLGGYRTMSGTSVAAPMVAGLCAILKQKYENASALQIKKMLLNSAKSINASSISQGYGVANVFRFID